MEITRDNLLSLIQNGLKQHLLSIAKLEKQAGVPKDTVRDFLRAKTQILRADKLQKILRVLQPESKLLVRGELNATAEIVPVPETAAKDYVEFPPGFEAGSVEAVRVKGDAMSPVFPEGWVVYYATGAHHGTAPHPKSTPHVPYNKSGSGEAYGEFLGKPCVIKLADGRLMLRTLKAGAHGHYTLAAYNTPDIKDASVKDVYKIVYIKP